MMLILLSALYAIAAFFIGFVCGRAFPRKPKELSPAVQELCFQIEAGDHPTVRLDEHHVEIGKYPHQRKLLITKHENAALHKAMNSQVETLLLEGKLKDRPDPLKPKVRIKRPQRAKHQTYYSDEKPS